jgi:hypothetical protein
MSLGTLLELRGAMITIAFRRATDSIPDHIPGAVPESPRGIVASALARVQQGLCGLHGHDALLKYERNRIYLRCTSCGYESPGWEVAGSAAVARLRADDRTAAPDLVMARKIA